MYYFAQKLNKWCQDEMADGWQFADNIFKCIFFNEKVWISIHISLKLRTKQHWFRLWLGIEQATSHYLNQWWSSSLTQICFTQSQWDSRWIDKGWTMQQLFKHETNIFSLLFNWVSVMHICFWGINTWVWHHPISRSDADFILISALRNTYEWNFLGNTNIILTFKESMRKKNLCQNCY